MTSGVMQAFRQAFPQFAQRGEGGGFAQQDADEFMTQLCTSLSAQLKEAGSDAVTSAFGGEFTTV